MRSIKCNHGIFKSKIKDLDKAQAYKRLISYGGLLKERKDDWKMAI
ncbi:hypothetical protein [Peribacillus simplex]